jgi:O-antigen ligase
VGNISSTTLVLVGAGVVGMVAYFALVLAPAWSSYGRLWERVAAGFLSLYILATFVGVGLGIGFAVVWFYDRYAG